MYIIKEMARVSSDEVGECQICGSIQKLPSGNLALHGYEVAKYGFFNGICPGSRNLPYEKSCDLVKQSIIDMKKRITDTKNEISKLMVVPKEPFAIVRYKEPKGYRIGRHMLCVIEENPIGVINISPVTTSNKKIAEYPPMVIERENLSILGSYSLTKMSLLQMAHYFNKKYVSVLEGQISQMENFIENQKIRVSQWVLKDTTKVKAHIANVKAAKDAEKQRNRKPVIEVDFPDGQHYVKKIDPSKIDSIKFMLILKMSYGNSDLRKGKEWVFSRFYDDEKKAKIAGQKIVEREMIGNGNLSPNYGDYMVLAVGDEPLKLNYDDKVEYKPIEINLPVSNGISGRKSRIRHYVSPNVPRFAVIYRIVSPNQTSPWDVEEIFTSMDKANDFLANDKKQIANMYIEKQIIAI